MATLINTDGSSHEVRAWKSLAAQQQHVGGNIEEIHFSDGSAFIVNEDGRSKELPFNGAAGQISAMKGGPAVLVGPVLFLSADEMRELRHG